MMASKEDEFASMERVRFEGESCIYTEEVDGNEVGVVQAAKPLTPENPYFEIEIENGGTMSWIGMGIASKGYDGDKQPGWAVASAGYHADDGCFYKAPRMDDRNSDGKPFPMPLTGEPYPCLEKGDKMGCGVEFQSYGKDASNSPMKVFFTKNGMYLGGVFLERQFDEAMYPTVGFNSVGARAKIDLNPPVTLRRQAEIQHAAQSFGTNTAAIDIVKDCVADGADVNIRDAAGRSPLHMACAYGATPIAELLLEKGADPDVQDNMGLTPLHMASGYVRPATAKILVENGADPDLRTQRNERALDLIRNLRNATKETSMGGLVKDKRYPVMTEIVDILERITENPDEWIVPEPVKLDEKTEEGIKEAMENAKNMVEEMKKDPEKMKELEQAMELMKDPEFQKKVKEYAKDPEGMKKLMEEYKDKINL